jgi:hypothetical protein
MKKGYAIQSVFVTILVVLFCGICSIVYAQKTDTPKEEALFAALDPRGTQPPGDLIPLAPRVSDLNGKTVYIIKSWPRDSGLEGMFNKAAEAIKNRFPAVTVVSKDRNTRYSFDDPELWKEMKDKKVATFIYGVAPSSSTTAYAFKYSAKLEKDGIPGTVLIFDSLISVAKDTQTRIGAPVRYTAVSYPETSLSENQVSNAMNSIIGNLTSPLTNEETKTGKYEPPKYPRIACTGTLSQVQDYFYKQGMTDGLPIIPPTEEKVAEMLRGTSHRPDEVLTTGFPPERLVVTVEKVAINGVMAGCKPEYMPVLLASVEAFMKRDYESVVRSTGSFSFMEIINGPIRKQLEMNADAWAVGSVNQANAAIGRALRLFIINLGGGKPGINMMGVIGNTSSVSFCFPEYEERSPWTPLSVELGFKPDENTLTLFNGGWSHMGNYGYTSTPLFDVGRDIAAFEYPSGAVILISAGRADVLKKEGLSKEAVKDQIWKEAMLSLGEYKSGNFSRSMAADRVKRGELKQEELNQPDNTLISAYSRNTIYIVVVGGDGAPMMQAWQMSNPQSVSIDKWR